MSKAKGTAASVPQVPEAGFIFPTPSTVATDEDKILEGGINHNIMP